MGLVGTGQRSLGASHYLSTWRLAFSGCCIRRKNNIEVPIENPGKFWMRGWGSEGSFVIVNFKKRVGRKLRRIILILV